MADEKRRTLCCSVRVAELKNISAKAVKITCHDGSSDIFPKSGIFGQDYEVLKCDAYWIAKWLLQKKSITYSDKKQAWCADDGTVSHVSFVTHIPTYVEPKENNEIPSLLAD